uniref:aldehyde dehydrogenase family protein n=1 Tax=Rhizobium sp. F40D2 TaxID=3453141 RepID=UPI003F26876E
MKLGDLSLFRQACPVAGRWIEAEDRQATTVRNPATGEPLGSVPDLGAAETEDAIAAAVIAQKLWAKRTAGERAAVLKAWHRLMIENRDDLAMILTLEQENRSLRPRERSPMAQALSNGLAEEARRINGETIPAHNRTSAFSCCASLPAWWRRSRPGIFRTR